MTKSKRKPGHEKRDQPRMAPSRRHGALVFILLALATLAVFMQVWNHDFVTYQDPDYVTANPIVRAGVTPGGAAWAFTTYRIGKWFPLSWLSHMADCGLFGMRSGPHHLMNLLLHVCSTLLLFGLLQRMTGDRWRSAVVAWLFALHPLHVESVAWAAQRKDVLSALFWFLTIWAYLSYIERPKPVRYLLLLVPFCLGLLSGPTVIALPLVLVLLDVWPLRRIRVAEPAGAGRSPQQAQAGREVKSFSGILLEKALLFELSASVAIAMMVFQKPEATVMPQAWIPFGTRLANVLLSCVAYLWQTIWPARLAVFYPYPSSLPSWQVIGAGLAIAGISFLALRLIRRFPYLAVGWFWYLAALAPVIGLVLSGMEPQADRYTYIPLVGIFLTLSWGVAEALTRLPGGKTALAFIAIALCPASMILSWNQIRHWRNSEALFQHAIDVTSGNHVAYYRLGGVFRDQGRMKEAILSYAEAIRLLPGDARAYGELAEVLYGQGRVEEAVAFYREAVRLNPNSQEDRISLGIALDRSGKAADSIEQLAEAIKINPRSADAHYNLGRIYADLGRLSEAAAQFVETIGLQPDNAGAHYNLGTALAGQGKMNEAVASFERAVQLKPDYASAHNNLGSALANLGRIDEAVVHFSEAVRLTPDSEEARRNLQYALTLQGKLVKR
jgi:tetratricopeptide (TPR) repeat protein